MSAFHLPEPAPDCEKLVKIIKREIVPDRVRFAELHIDSPVLAYLAEKEFGLTWVNPEDAKDRAGREKALSGYMACWHRLGYDYVRFTTPFRFSSTIAFKSERRAAGDTALLSGGERKWVEQRQHTINSWEDFERFPWPSAEAMDLWAYEYAAAHLPEGMGIFACFSQGMLEALTNEIFGTETLSFLMYDKPDLLEAVIDRAGGIMYGAYKKIIGLDHLLGFFQGDDMGHKHATLFSPAFLKKYILPWHKKVAALAHENGLLYVLHSCGNIAAVMEDLIEDVGIDARHSFEDAVMPVAEFKKQYGDRTAVLGGVDMDKLCRLEERELRHYVRGILDACMPGGGYLLGSGNSIANYVPLQNYLALLDEGVNWKP